MEIDDIVYEVQADLQEFRRQAEERIRRVIDELFEMEFKEAA